MVRLQWMVAVMVLAMSVTSAEARGRRMMQQQSYRPYYNNAVPTYTNAVPTNVVIQAAPAATPTNVVTQTNSVVTSENAVVQANSTSAVPGSVVPAAPAAAAAVGSAQWKAEQSARMGSVQHIGGGFGGGSFEGNGFGPTADQAIRNSCFWGQRTPIEIGVARGANGYYATVFYR